LYKNHRFLIRIGIAGIFALAFLTSCAGVNKADSDLKSIAKEPTGSFGFLGDGSLAASNVYNAKDTSSYKKDSWSLVLAQSRAWLLYGREALLRQDWNKAQQMLDQSVRWLLAHPAPPKSDTLLYKEREILLAELWRELELVYPLLASNGSYKTTLQKSEANDESLSSIGETKTFADSLRLKGFSLPLEWNERVQAEVRYFTQGVPAFMRKSLQRMQQYDSLILDELNTRKMPADLIYLPLVESGFKYTAYSPAGAGGIWQFIPATGKRYQLQVDWWVDERRSPHKATDAALRYLHDLYNEFGDWLLAMAAYNCGEGCVRRAIRKGNTRNYWDLDLPKETMHYVPRILAAMIIGHFPERFAVSTDSSDLKDWQSTQVEVKHCLSLQSIADSLNISTDSLQALNPDLLRWCTPPSTKKFSLNLPMGMDSLFLAYYNNLDAAQLTRWHRHKVTWGENLGSIAELYGLSVKALKEANKMKSSALRSGQHLVIPLPPSALPPQDILAQERAREAEEWSTENRMHQTYTVQSGDNLYDIARRFDVSLKALQHWNKLGEKSLLSVGQNLHVYTEKENTRSFLGQSRATQAKAKTPIRTEPSAQAKKTPKGQRYVVQTGDNLYLIARKFGISVKTLQEWNELENSRIHPGQTLAVGTNDVITEDNSAKGVVWYVVRSGDSLWDIGRRYGVSMQQLRDWNQLGQERLQPGRRLKVYLQ
jgi:membrane-bound lytic murein transglycosylase D